MPEARLHRRGWYENMTNLFLLASGSLLPISVMGKLLVFETNIQLDLAAWSSWAKSFCLISIFSIIASITRSALHESFSFCFSNVSFVERKILGMEGGTGWIRRMDWPCDGSCWIYCGVQLWKDLVRSDARTRFRVLEASSDWFGDALLSLLESFFGYIT